MELTFIIAGQTDPPDRADELARQARNSGAHALLISDLYDMPPDDPAWDALRSLQGKALVLSTLHPRAAEWVLRRNGVKASEAHCLRLDTEGVSERVSSELQALAEAGESTGSLEDLRRTVQPRWYPVLDASRCERCGHCVQFCLFGVWADDGDGRPHVVSPDACKDGCPACARVCPHGAIMFPRCEQDPAVAGAPGAVLKPDPAARRMYYVRTKTPCPLCGLVGTDGLRPREGVAACPECGRFPQAPPTVVQAEIDALINDLDALLGGERR